MPIVAGIIVPHPPIIVPEIGGKSLTDVADTVAAMKLLAGDVALMDIDTIVAVSPHSLSLADAFLIRKNAESTGSFTGFGCPQLKYRLSGNTRLAESIIEKCNELDVPVLAAGDRGAGDDDHLDHGLLVPYYYLSASREYRLVSLSISGLDLEYHYKFGKAVAAACGQSDANILFMASGDLSHRLTPTAPAGYTPAGALLDREIVGLIDRSDLSGLLELDHNLVREGGECGLRSLVILAGVLSASKYRSQRLSYEGPFGVGYLVAVVKLGKE